MKCNTVFVEVLYGLQFIEQLDSSLTKHQQQGNKKQNEETVYNCLQNVCHGTIEESPWAAMDPTVTKL